MKDYLLVFRTDENTMQAFPKRSPEEMQVSMKRWMDWIGGIAAQNKLTDRGNRLVPSGQVVKSNNVIADGPYSEIKECIIGYSIVKATSIEEAAELAKGCPVLTIGGNVEIREISAM
ncbi:YciI family protein [Flavitalea sp.]|nr:YciI family protein [Flavitalea sp.]